MKMKLLGLIGFAAIGALALSRTANANTCPVSDTCLTYNVFGSFASDEYDPSGPPLPPTPIPLSGKLIIDVTNGTITAADLTIPGLANLNVVGTQFTSPNSTGLLYQLNVSAINGDEGYIDFIYPYDQSNPLVGHPYIEIDQGEFDTAGNPSFVPFGLTGYIQATPIPAALPLFAGGLGALGLFGWRRKRKNAAAIAA